MNNVTLVGLVKSLLTGEIREDLKREETLADLFQHTVNEYPNKVALIFHQQHITYAQLNNWANAIATDLIQKGIGPGKYVGVWIPRGLALHAAILGIIKSGAAYVPIDREMPAERAETVLEEVNAIACFSNDNLNTKAEIITVVPIPKEENIQIANQGLLPDNDAYVLYTSGSTGKPKGIAISHRNICHFIRAENSVLIINSNDKVFQGFSVSFDMWCEETWISYFAGATLWVADNTTSKAIDELSELLNKEKITILHAVPSLLAVMEDDIPLLRLINSGGEACLLRLLINGQNLVEDLSIVMVQQKPLLLLQWLI